MNMQRHASCSRYGSVGKYVVGAPPFLELLLRELESFVNDAPASSEDGSTS
jgi:hypothetical protein